MALLPERLDQIDAWIGEGLINGPELNAADFQIAVNVAALLTSEDFAPLIEARPAAALARRVVVAVFLYQRATAVVERSDQLRRTQ